MEADGKGLQLLNQRHPEARFHRPGKPAVKAAVNPVADKIHNQCHGRQQNIDHYRRDEEGAGCGNRIDNVGHEYRQHQRGQVLQQVNKNGEEEKPPVSAGYIQQHVRRFMFLFRIRIFVKPADFVRQVHDFPRFCEHPV